MNPETLGITAAVIVTLFNIGLWVRRKADLKSEIDFQRRMLGKTHVSFLNQINQMREFDGKRLHSAEAILERVRSRISVEWLLAETTYEDRPVELTEREVIDIHLHFDRYDPQPVKEQVQRLKQPTQHDHES